MQFILELRQHVLGGKSKTLDFMTQLSFESVQNRLDLTLIIATRSFARCRRSIAHVVFTKTLKQSFDTKESINEGLQTRPNLLENWPPADGLQMTVGQMSDDSRMALG